MSRVLLSFRSYALAEREERLEAEVTRELALSLYSKMVLSRVLEEELKRRYESFEMRGELHLSRGQEAIPAGVCELLSDRDFVSATHRCIAHAVCKGLPLEGIIAELYGRASGVCKGKGGPMHLASSSKRFLATGIVGGGIPIAVGAALAFKTLREDSVAVAFFGDGAANQGTFHESLNLASIYRLPVVFVIEDNQYAFSTRRSESTAIEDNAIRALGYRMPGLVVDGNDAIAVYAAARWAIERARRGGGPALLDCKTYRLSPHLEVIDTEEYRPGGERERWERLDPVRRLEEKAVGLKLASSEDFEQIWSESRELVEEAFRRALSSPLPSQEEAFCDLFSGECYAT